MCALQDVRQNSENPCTLEKTSDGILWEPFANLRLCAPLLRQLGNRTQYSSDGLTWYTVPDGDYTPGYNDPAPNPRPPAPPGQDDCCLAAANAENAIFLTYADLSPEWPIVPGFEAILGADVANFLHLLIGPLYDAFEFGIKLLTAFIAGVIFDIGDYTEEVREQLRTIICENITVTDFVPDIDFEAVTSEVGGLGGGVWSGINTILAMIGPSGLNLAAATTALTEADCDGCGCDDSWCWNADFEGAQAQGFVNYDGTGTGTGFLGAAGWVAGVDAPNSTKYVHARRSFTSTTINTITLNYDLTPDDCGDGANNVQCRVFLEGVLQWVQGHGVSSPETDASWLFNLGGVLCDEVDIGVECGCFEPYGTGVIHSAQFTGNGEPIDTPNC